MAETKPLILYSRSAVTTDWTCPRKRYWNYEYDGRGLTSGETFLPLFLGIVLHDGLAAIAHGVDIDSIADAARTEVVEGLVKPGDGDDARTFACEQASLTEGLLRGFRRHMWPIIMDQYPEIVAIEREFTYEHDGLTFMAKPDLILRDREGSLWYLEYKSTSSAKESWINSWQTAVQLHSSVRAAEQALGEKFAGVIVQGLYKGYVSGDKQSSPFCYAYHKPAEPPFTKATWSYAWKSGLKKYPIWLRDGSVKRWVEEMPIEILSEQFPQVPPIFLNDHLIDSWFRQRAIREWDIRNAREQIADPNLSDYEKQQWLDQAFPQHFEQCQPGWGSGCTYKRLCHGLSKNPLDAGYVPRVSHHAIEQEAIDAAN